MEWNSIFLARLIHFRSEVPPVFITSYLPFFSPWWNTVYRLIASKAQGGGESGIGSSSSGFQEEEAEALARICPKAALSVFFFACGSTTTILTSAMFSVTSSLEFPWLWFCHIWKWTARCRYRCCEQLPAVILPAHGIIACDIHHQDYHIGTAQWLGSCGHMEIPGFSETAMWTTQDCNLLPFHFATEILKIRCGYVWGHAETHWVSAEHSFIPWKKIKIVICPLDAHFLQDTHTSCMILSKMPFSLCLQRKVFGLILWFSTLHMAAYSLTFLKAASVVVPSSLRSKCGYRQLFAVSHF